RASDRQRAILQAVHRAQAARLDLRWNQGDVGAGFDEVRQRFVVMTAIGELRWVLARGNGERGLVPGVAFAEDDQPDVVGEKAVEQRHEEIEPLFGNESRYHSEDGPARRRGKTQSVEKQIAADRFALKIPRTELARQQMIGLGIPALVIGAIQDSHQAM